MYPPCQRIFRHRWFVGNYDIKRPMSLCTREQSKKHRSRCENVWMFCLFCSHNSKIANMADTFLGKFTRCAKVRRLFLIVLFGCWWTEQTNPNHMAITPHQKYRNHKHNLWWARKVLQSKITINKFNSVCFWYQRKIQRTSKDNLVKQEASPDLVCFPDSFGLQVPHYKSPAFTSS